MCSHRRAAIAALAVVLAGALAAGGVLAQATLTDAASAPSVDDATLSEYGYEFTREETYVLEDQVSAPNGTLTLRGTSEAVEYRRVVDLGPLGDLDASVFGLTAIPAFERSGTVLNPIDDYENPRLASLLEARFSQITIGRPVENTSVTLLGTETNLTIFEGFGRVGNVTIAVDVYVAHVRSGEDFVVAAGVHPQLLGDQTERFREMMAGVRHPGSAPTGVSAGTGGNATAGVSAGTVGSATAG